MQPSQAMHCKSHVLVILYGNDLSAKVVIHIHGAGEHGTCLQAGWLA